MKRIPRSRRGTLILTLLGLASVACCPAWDPRKVDGVRIADQEVLIYYDSESGVEHFVRRADFRTPAKEFGFLVPTPTQPRLTETDDAVFDRLTRATAPKIERTKKYSLSFLPLIFRVVPIGCGREQAPDSAPASVRVLDTASVGGFDASVLQADDADALLEWLEENEYDARPDLKEWVTPYIEKSWIITAFKYDQEPDYQDVSTAAAVCMSFPTDKPFFPYRVPADQLAAPGKGSTLRVFYMGDERVDGQFETGDKTWPGKTTFANAVENPGKFLESVGGDEPPQVPESLWLTTFEDDTWPGGTEDLYFSQSSDSTALSPAPVEITERVPIPIPPDVILLGLWAFVIIRRKKAKQE